jgi:hypothetical protein
MMWTWELDVGNGPDGRITNHGKWAFRDMLRLEAVVGKQFDRGFNPGGT